VTVAFYPNDCRVMGVGGLVLPAPGRFVLSAKTPKRALSPRGIGVGEGGRVPVGPSYEPRPFRLTRDQYNCMVSPMDGFRGRRVARGPAVDLDRAVGVAVASALLAGSSISVQEAHRMIPADALSTRSRLGGNHGRPRGTARVDVTPWHHGGLTGGGAGILWRRRGRQRFLHGNRLLHS